jgi:hypothetical protein
MTRSATLTTAALAIAIGAAGPAQAATEPPPEQQKTIKAVVVLIGANDYGLVAPAPARAAAYIRGP